MTDDVHLAEEHGLDLTVPEQRREGTASHHAQHAGQSTRAVVVLTSITVGLGDPAMTQRSCASARRYRSPRTVRSQANKRITSALRSAGAAATADSTRLVCRWRLSAMNRHAASAAVSLPGGAPAFSPNILLALNSPTHRSMRMCALSSWLPTVVAPAAKSTADGRKRASHASVSQSSAIISSTTSAQMAARSSALSLSYLRATASTIWVTFSRSAAVRRSRSAFAFASSTSRRRSLSRYSPPS
eukprot:scaffold12490_cov66-Phaeocystis_antarctica.AAC.4